jgi:hypothetical protein
MSFGRKGFEGFTATGLAAALTLCGSLALTKPARALDDDGRQNVFASVLSMIDFSKQWRGSTPDIDYRERPTLVLPPKMELPQPLDPEVKHSAEWPQDPDVLRRKREAEQAKLPIHILSGGQDNDRLLTKDQMLAHTAASPAPAPQNLNPDYKHCSHGGQCDWMDPNVIEQEGQAMRKALHVDDSSNTIVAGQEPPRKYLTDPPGGYRKATATVKATQGGPVVQKTNNDNILSFWKEMNPFKEDDDN